MNEIEYCMVIDANGKKLAPTRKEKAWYKIRHKKAILLQKCPMAIQLNKVVNSEDPTTYVMGIDDGTKHVGGAIIQRCKTKHKVLFLAQVDLRGLDVSKRLKERSAYRGYRRSHKRYRPARFNNRKKGKGWIPPSIKHNRDTILRFIKSFTTYMDIDDFYWEEVKIDIQRVTDESITYYSDRTKSYKNSESVRLATIIRDKNTCQMCGKKKCKKEVHHITPRKVGGANTLKNTITLCHECHSKVTGVEKQYSDLFYDKISGKNINLKYPMHVMQGKTYFENELANIFSKEQIHKTTGEKTSVWRNIYGIEKTHSNDAIAIAECIPDRKDIIEYRVKLFRRKKQERKCNKPMDGVYYQDIVEYYYPRLKEKHRGYITAMYVGMNKIRFISKYKDSKTGKDKVCDKVNPKKCKKITSGKGLVFY